MNLPWSNLKFYFFTKIRCVTILLCFLRYYWVILDIDFLFSFYLTWFPFFSREIYHENFRLIVHPCSQGPDFYASLHEFAYNRPFAASYPRGTKLPCWRVRVSVPTNSCRRLLAWSPKVHLWRGKLKRTRYMLKDFFSGAIKGISNFQWFTESNTM